MSRSVITNFKVNAYTPIDTRLVATNSAALNEIQYPYEGLTVFTKDRNLNYTYNGSAWQVSSNGIYGGSGSMVGSTDVNMGQVGGATNDRAFELVLSASSSTSPDRAQYATSFIRNNTGIDYDTVEVRNQVRYIDNGRVLNGPYISFNKNDTKKGIISLGTPDRNFVTTVERFRIEPDSSNRNNGAIILTPSTYSPPLTISQNSRNGLFIGYNFDGINKNIDGTASSTISFNGGRISFGNIPYSYGGASILTPTEILRIGSINGFLDTDQDFVQVSVKSSPSSEIAPTWPNNTREFLPITDIITNLEHKYVKTQYLGYDKTVNFPGGYNGEISTKTYLLDNKTILVTNNGNFFDFELPVDQRDSSGVLISIPEILDIKIVRWDDSEFYPDSPPAGTSITIRFTYEKSPIVGNQNLSSQIKLWQNSSHTTRKIRSSYADINGGETIIIRHNLGSSDSQDRNEAISGDIITFMRGGDNYWYITNIQREKEILKKISGSSLTWYNFADNRSTILGETLGRIYAIYQPSPTLWVWRNTDRSAEFAANSGVTRGPHSFPFTLTNRSTSADVLPSVPLGFAKDTDGRVYVRGSFRITDIDKIHLTSGSGSPGSSSAASGPLNQFYIADVLETSWRPPAVSNPANPNTYTAWGYCEVFIYYGAMPNTFNNGSVQVQGRLYIDPSGRIILQFPMLDFTYNIISTTTYNYRFIVHVPQFSYWTV